MTLWSVEVTFTETVEVEADSEQEACDKAIEKADVNGGDWDAYAEEIEYEDDEAGEEEDEDEE